jgi:hypothetical protein
MKANVKVELCGTTRRAVRGIAAVLLAGLLAGAFAAAPGGAGEAKPYTLFLGTDLSVERDNRFHRVRDVKGGSFVIEVDKTVVRVPMQGGGVNLKFEQSLKLTEASASIANLKFDRAYTPANDPGRKFQQNQEFQDEAANDAMAAQGHMAGVSQGLERSVGIPAIQLNGQGGMVGEANHMMDAASQGIGVANARQGASGVGSTGAMDFQNAVAEGQFDAMEVSFEASAEKALANPYLVVITRYKERNGKPGMSRNWIYAVPLDPISGKPVKVHFLQGGLPPGFEIEGFQVHLYDGGEEIATNVAPKHMALSRDQAFQYMTLEYVLGHKGETLQAAPASATLPADLRARVSDSQLNETIYVRVSKDGSAGQAFMDPLCSRRASDADIDSAVKCIRFTPALDRGKAVDGVCAFKLGQVLM